MWFKFYPCQVDLPSPLIKDVQDYIKQLFSTGQNDLQSREHEASEKDERENESDHPFINRFKLNVQTNAVCVDILVWATKDEQGKILFQLTNRFWICSETPTTIDYQNPH